MKGKRAKTLSILLSLVFILSLLPACGQSAGNSSDTASTAAATTAGTTVQATEKEDLSPITFTALDVNGEKEWGNDEVSQEITKQTGVSLKYMPIGNDADGKLLILLASGDIPDLVGEGLFSVVENKYVAAGAALQLDDLVDKYGPDIKSEIGDEYLNMIRSQHDGKLFSLPSWYSRPFKPSANGALLIRKDILQEFAPQKAEGEGYFTFDEYMNIMKQVKEKYPDMIPYLPCGENLEWWVLWPFRGFMGIYNYSVQADQVKLYYRDPKMLEAYKYLNSIMRNGYSDPEWATLKTDPFEQKLATGNVFSTTGAYWNAMDAAEALQKAGKSQFLPYKIAGPGADPQKLTLGGTNELGWGGIFVSKNVKDPVRMVKFLNFMASEKGQELAWFGIEGKHWDMVDGLPVPKQEVLDAFNAGGDTWNEFLKTSGVNGKWDWMVGSLSDKSWNSIGAYVSRNNKPSELDAMAMKTIWDTSYPQDIFIGIEPDPNTPEDLTSQKIKDIWLQDSVSIINAKSDAECVELYNKMLSDVSGAGAEAYEKVLTDKFDKRLKAGFPWNN